MSLLSTRGKWRTSKAVHSFRKQVDRSSAFRCDTAAAQDGAISNRFGGKKSRCQPSRSVHGSPLGRHGTSRRCSSVVCSNAKSAQSRCVVGHSNARCQWPTLNRGENLRQPRPCLLRTAHHSGGLCSVGAPKDPSARSSQRISAWRTGSHCRLGSHAGSEDSAPQTRTSRCSEGQLSTRSRDCSATHRRTWKGARVPLY